MEVYPTALSAAEVGNLYGQGRTGGDLVRGGLTTATAGPARPGHRADQPGRRHHRLLLRRGRPPDGRHRPARRHRDRRRRPGRQAPPTTTGYDTFGEVAETKDPNGNITTYAYDADGRQVSETLPSYTPPGASTRSTARHRRCTTRSARSPRRPTRTETTTHVHLRPARRPDQPDRLTSNGTTGHSYDADGEQLSQTGPTGAQTTATYDFLGRQLTATDVERTSRLVHASSTRDHDHDFVRAHAARPERDLEVVGHLPGRRDHQLRVRRGGGDDAGHRRRGQRHHATPSTPSAARSPPSTRTAPPDTVTYDPAGNQSHRPASTPPGKPLTSTTGPIRRRRRPALHHRRPRRHHTVHLRRGRGR